MWCDSLILYKRKGSRSSAISQSAQLSEGMQRVHDRQHSTSKSSHVMAQSSECHLKSGSGCNGTAHDTVTGHGGKEKVKGPRASRKFSYLGGPGVLPLCHISRARLLYKYTRNYTVFFKDNTSSPRPRLYTALCLTPAANKYDSIPTI